MATKLDLNLLPKDTFYESGLGKMVKWATSVGRWIVVFTDLVVISSFLSRFYFDTKLADYHDDIKQKQAIITALSNFEDSFRSFQNRIALIKTFTATKIYGKEKTEMISQILPPDISLLGFSLSGDKIDLSGVALSQSGFAAMIRNLLFTPQITSVNIGQLSISSKEKTEVLNFSLTLIWKEI